MADIFINHRGDSAFYFARNFPTTCTSLSLLWVTSVLSASHPYHAGSFAVLSITIEGQIQTETYRTLDASPADSDRTQRSTIIGEQHMTSHSYLEYVLTLLSWLVSNSIWHSITATGLFALPLKLISVGLKAREPGADEIDASALTLA